MYAWTSKLFAWCFGKYWRDFSAKMSASPGFGCLFGFTSILSPGDLRVGEVVHLRIYSDIFMHHVYFTLLVIAAKCFVIFDLSFSHSKAHMISLNLVFSIAVQLTTTMVADVLHYLVTYCCFHWKKKLAGIFFMQIYIPCVLVISFSTWKRVLCYI